jgi:prepilin-type N-terminal cleavage/methylation domain-containing protein
MSRLITRGRRGFTLVELLVVMALIATLAALAMIVAPGIMEKDRSVDAVNQLEGWLQISRARAQRDRLPRGVRLIVDPNKADPLQVTEAQYIESPPVFVPNPDGPGANPMSTGRVVFGYTTNPTGTVTGRTCVIQNLTPDQAAQVKIGVVIWLPVLGTWHRVIGSPVDLDTGPYTPPSPQAQSLPLDTAKLSIGVKLNQYPDAQLGAGTSYVTYHFGIYGLPRPLLGEPTMQLPTNACVDLNQNVSSPGVSKPLPSPVQDYDILFAPGGQLAFTASTQASGHVFLWVRDLRKLGNATITPTPVPGPALQYQLSDFQRGGEMMIVAIKAKSGAIGAGPVNWPDTATANSPPYDPYYFARKAVSAP